MLKDALKVHIQCIGNSYSERKRKRKKQESCDFWLVPAYSSLNTYRKFAFFNFFLRFTWHSDMICSQIA